MIDIQALFNEVKREADARNIVYDKNCTCVVNGRLKSAWGAQCLETVQQRDVGQLCRAFCHSRSLGKCFGDKRDYCARVVSSAGSP